MKDEGSCYRCGLMSFCRLLVISHDVEEVVVGTPPITPFTSNQ